MMNRVVVKGIFGFSMLVSMVVDDRFWIAMIPNWLTCMYIHACCTCMHTKFSRTLSLSLSFFPKSPKLTYHYFLRWSVNFCHFFNLDLKSSVQFKVSSSIYRCWKLVLVISLSSVGLICCEFWSIGDFIILLFESLGDFVGLWWEF